jgi:MoaA/NifB/PqqE/SkfB family radical SAM enzyme
MTRKVFEAALKYCESDSLSIGGGEPTLHPHFWEFLARAMGAAEYVWLATNGSQTETALVLAKMARKGVIACALSQDYYHDPIDERVVEAFTKKEPTYMSGEKDDSREIRTVTNHPESLAPFRNPEDGGNPDECPCDSMVITPSGKVRFCGCRNAPVIGDVFKGFAKPEDAEEHDCWNKYQQSKNVAA